MDLLALPTPWMGLVGLCSMGLSTARCSMRETGMSCLRKPQPTALSQEAVWSSKSGARTQRGLSLTHCPTHLLWGLVLPPQQGLAKL